MAAAVVLSGTYVLAVSVIGDARAAPPATRAMIVTESESLHTMIWISPRTGIKRRVGAGFTWLTPRLCPTGVIIERAC